MECSDGTFISKGSTIEVTLLNGEVLYPFLPLAGRKCGKNSTACGACGLGGEPEPEPSSCVMAARSSGAQGHLSDLWQDLARSGKVKSGAGIFFL